MAKRKDLTTSSYVMKGGVPIRYEELSTEERIKFANGLNLNAMESAGYAPSDPQQKTV